MTRFPPAQARAGNGEIRFLGVQGRIEPWAELGRVDRYTEPSILKGVRPNLFRRPSIRGQHELRPPANPRANDAPQQRPTQAGEIDEASPYGALDDGIASCR
jgi:hypothetical protein